MAFGIATWDAQGRPNNYGIKPVSVVGIIKLSQGQTSGSWSFSIPSGMKVGFAVTLDVGGTTVGRAIRASGNKITVSSANSAGIGNYPASECEVVVFVEKA